MSTLALLSRFGLASVALLIMAAVPAPSIAEPAEVGLATASGQQMHEHFQALDRKLRLQLLGLAKGREGAVSAEDVERLQFHLRSLEHRLQTWENGAELIERVRALQPLLDHLERAIEKPEAAKRDPHRALKVEWPAPADRQLKGTPANDDCAFGTPIGNGTFFGDTTTATADGASCYAGSPDVWFAYTAPATGWVVADTFGSGFDTVLSVHAACPGTLDNELACNDNTFGLQSSVSFQVQAGFSYRIRVAGAFDAVGPFTLNVGPGGAITGTVIDDATHEPVAGINIEAWDAEGGFAGNVTTGPDGSYEIPGLQAGNHFVFTAFAQSYLQEIYDDVPCSFTFGCEPLGGTPVEVVSGQTTGGIDFALNRGGSISGTVTQRTTGEPPESFSTMIEVYDDAGTDFLGYTFVDDEGAYFLRGLTAGSYLVFARSTEFVDELYNNKSCPGGLFVGCLPSDGTPVEVSFDTTTLEIDFELERLGGISGIVTDANSGEPLSVVDLSIWDADRNLVGSGFADESGFYQVGGLSLGAYYVTTRAQTYFDELYDDLPCEPGCDPTTGSRVVVNLNEITTGIDFALERLGAITGTVTHSESGEPVPGIDVTVYGEFGPIDFSPTSSTGTYFIEGLVPGPYTALASDFEYFNELYREIPCEGDCDPTTGTPIAVNLNTVTDGVDFTPDRKGKISGRVTHSVTGEPLSFVGVDVYDANGQQVSGARTDSEGNYVVAGLDPGLHFAVAGNLVYLAELYDDLPCVEGCDPTVGQPIPVHLNAVTGGIDFALDRRGTISGFVRHAGQGVNAFVYIYDADGKTRWGDTADLGRYHSDPLTPGTYFVVAHDFRYHDELYDNIPCEEGCDPTLGTPVQVTANTRVQNIDLDLGYCTPTATSLCLTGDRFRVEADWEDFENETGPAFADGLTPDAGTFWFFNPNNVEMVVKILDICDRPENRFWVFAAGLTNVGVDLRVTDGLTGEVVNYSNPLGMTYETVLDTQAFATCDAGPGGVSRSVSEVSLATPKALPVTAAEKGDCVPSATTLCLNGGRFMAEVDWLTPEGIGGAARAEPLTEETGYFWFGSADNVEVMVKVLDACGLPSFQNYWVFGAGLTNFEVTLRVTDTETGEVQEYFNPQGRTFETVTDLGNFMTCP